MKYCIHLATISNFHQRIRLFIGGSLIGGLVHCEMKYHVHHNENTILRFSVAGVAAISICGLLVRYSVTHFRDEKLNKTCVGSTLFAENV